MGKPTQNYGVSPKYCHTILLAARDKRAHPTLTLISKAILLLDLPTRKDGRLSWPRCLDYAPTGNRTHDRLIVGQQSRSTGLVAVSVDSMISNLL